MLRVLQLTQDPRGKTYHWAIVNQLKILSEEELERKKNKMGFLLGAEEIFRVIDFSQSNPLTSKEWRRDSQLRASYRNFFDLYQHRQHKSLK
jgi:hypothetical protein